MALPSLAQLLTLFRFTAMYFVQGLPAGFYAKQLPVYLRSSGYSLKQLGSLGVLSIPWSLKVFAAPFVESHWAPWVGKRKSWIIPLQFLLFLTMLFAGMAMSVKPLIGLIIFMNFCTAIQDIAVDGLAIDKSHEESVSLVNSVQIVGFKAGILVGGGGLALVCNELDLPLRYSFFFMAAIVLLILLVCVIPMPESSPAPAPASSSTTQASTSAGRAGEQPSSDQALEEKAKAERRKEGSFLKSIRIIAENCGRPEVAMMVLYIATYKAGEVMADTMFKPFLVDSGFTTMEIAKWSGVYGMLASIAGSLAGGLIAHDSSRTFLIAAALANFLPQLLRALLVLVPNPSPAAVVAVICMEAFSGGALTTRVFTWMMLQMTGKFAAQLASGFIAHYLGYAPMFLLGSLLTLGSLGVLLRSPLTTKTKAKVED